MINIVQIFYKSYDFSNIFFIKESLFVLIKNNFSKIISCKDPLSFMSPLLHSVEIFSEKLNLRILVQQLIFLSGIQCLSELL